MTHRFASNSFTCLFYHTNPFTRQFADFNATPTAGVKALGMSATMKGWPLEHKVAYVDIDLDFQADFNHHWIAREVGTILSDNGHYVEFAFGMVAYHQREDGQYEISILPYIECRITRAGTVEKCRALFTGYENELEREFIMLKIIADQPPDKQLMSGLLLR